MWIWHALSQWPSQAFSKLDTKLVCGCLPCSPVGPRSGRFDFVLASNSTLFRLVWKVARFWQQSKMGESRYCSSPTEPQLKFPGCSHFRRHSDKHYRCQQCRLNDGLTLCTQESPCDICKDWLPEAWQALDKAMRQTQKRKAAAAAKTAHDSMDDSIAIHAPEDGLQVPPVKRKDDESSRQQDSAKRAKTATSSTSKATDVWPSKSRNKRSSKTFSSSVSVVGRSSRSDGPSGTKGSDRRRSHSGERGHRDRSHGSERRHELPRAHHSPRRRETGERTRPSSSSGRSNSARQVDSTGLPESNHALGGLRMSGLLPLIISIITRGHRLIIGPCPLHLGHRLIVGPCPSNIIMEDVRVLTRISLGRPMCPDVMWNCLPSCQNHLRRELSQLSSRHPNQQEMMTRQVWRARRTRQRLPTRQKSRTRQVLTSRQ